MELIDFAIFSFGIMCGMVMTVAIAFSIGDSNKWN